MTGTAPVDQTTIATLGPGLVISAITARTTPAKPATHYPSRDLVGVSAATLAATAGQPEWDGSEGPRWFVGIGPGLVQVGSVDLAKAERAVNRRRGSRPTGARVGSDDRAGLGSDHRFADIIATGADEDGRLPDRLPVRGLITGWSAKSRANMVRRLCTLDYHDLFLPGLLAATLTATYPGEWLSVAPNGRAVKRHMRLFQLRWKRRFGTAIAGCWKLEFQHRGAPHVHILTAIPASITVAGFMLWFSETWSEIIDHQDPVERANGLAAGTGVDIQEGARMTDPKRIGVYFSKHGVYAAKDYQNDPPSEWAGESVGRFWGVWGLEPAVSSVAVSRDQALSVARTLRRWNRHQRYQRTVTVPRVEQATGRVRYRSVKTWVVRMPTDRGFLAVNDGPSVAMMLDRLLTPPAPPVSTPRHRQNPSTALRSTP
jgi:hypothetical protein